MRSADSPRPRRYWGVLIFLLLGTLAAAWHNRAIGANRPDPVAGTVRGVVAPPAGVMARVSRWFSGQTGWLLKGRELAAENQTLKARVAQLEGENVALREASINLERLRDDLGFVRTQKKPPLAAEVIARRPDSRFQTLVIGRGSRDGVQPKSVVMCPNGVVGQVYDVGLTTAAVLLLTDQNSGIGGRVQRAGSRAVGVCKGDRENPRQVWLNYLPSDADVKVGDVIVTSGLGSVFPPGLAIGEVVEVKMEPGNLQKAARLRLNVDFDRLEEVYVLR